MSDTLTLSEHHPSPLQVSFLFTQAQLPLAYGVEEGALQVRLYEAL